MAQSLRRVGGMFERAHRRRRVGGRRVFPRDWLQLSWLLALLAYVAFRICLRTELGYFEGWVFLACLGAIAKLVDVRDAEPSSEDYRHGARRKARVPQIQRPGL